MRRLAQTPRGWAKVWASVGESLRQKNPSQTEWHVSAFWVIHGLELDLSGHADLFDISPIVNLPIDWLDVSHTRVRDLTPLAGLGLKAVRADYCSIDDLTQIKGHPLERLSLVGAPLGKVEAIDRFPFLRFLDLGERRVLPRPTSQRTWENALGVRFLPMPNRAGEWMASREVTRKDFAAFLAQSADSSSSASPGIDFESLHPMLMDFDAAVAFSE